MFDSRKYCPQCGGDQLKYRTPQGAATKLARIYFFAMMLVISLGLIGARLPILFILMLMGLAVIAFMGFERTRPNNAFKIYRMKCQQCGHQWTMTKEEWLQAGDTPAQTKTLSPQEKEEKRAVVESLINQIKKM